MKTKQTAVEWLINKVEEHFCLLPVDLIEQAKDCALIAVDEIIKSQPSFPMSWNLGIEINGLVDNAMFPFNYYKKVKEELEKL